MRFLFDTSVSFPMDGVFVLVGLSIKSNWSSTDIEHVGSVIRNSPWPATSSAETLGRLDMLKLNSQTKP